jgi:hypothetical protein
MILIINISLRSFKLSGYTAESVRTEVGFKQWTRHITCVILGQRTNPTLTSHKGQTLSVASNSISRAGKSPELASAALPLLPTLLWRGRDAVYGRKRSCAATEEREAGHIVQEGRESPAPKGMMVVMPQKREVGRIFPEDG